MRTTKAVAKSLVPKKARAFLRRRRMHVEIVHADGDSWVRRELQFRHPTKQDARFELIAQRAWETEQLGAQPLWRGFAQVTDYPRDPVSDGTRTSEQVRTHDAMGRFFTHVVMQRRPELIVEFGTAFGISGMYWLTGLELNGSGYLLTFEPNEIWAGIAAGNLAATGTRYRQIVGTFEDNLGEIDKSQSTIDLAFIDAIHTSEFVLGQLDLVVSKASPGALIFLDDINFSDDMRGCWQGIAHDPRYAAAAEVGNVGLIELKG